MEVISELLLQNMRHFPIWMAQNLESLISLSQKA